MPPPRVFQPAAKPAPEAIPALPPPPPRLPEVLREIPRAAAPEPAILPALAATAQTGIKAASFDTEAAARGAAPLPARLRASGFTEVIGAAPGASPNTPARPSGFSEAPAPGVASLAARPLVPAGFGDAAAATRTAPARPAAPASATPVEILDKPRPAYTEEARRLSLEGEVLIEVLFEASGQTKVQRLIRGLGHGLDENAMSAARQIRFRPARQEGAAVDSLAVVHILFQLAY
jgi:TonB family protein